LVRLENKQQREPQGEKYKTDELYTQFIARFRISTIVGEIKQKSQEEYHVNICYTSALSTSVYAEQLTHMTTITCM
jgi:hypothetical protein